MNENTELIEVKIGALIMDPNTNSPIVILKALTGETVLPIWVGAFEANAIAVEIEKISPQRPMTHDLLRNLIIECGMTADRIVVTDLVENTFFARIDLTDRSGDKVYLDARPSDAIALALRMDCAIFVDQRVIDISAATSNPPEPISDESNSEEEWPEVLN